MQSFNKAEGKVNDSLLRAVYEVKIFPAYSQQPHICVEADNRQGRGTPVHMTHVRARGRSKVGSKVITGNHSKLLKMHNQGPGRPCSVYTIYSLHNMMWYHHTHIPYVQFWSQ